MPAPVITPSVTLKPGIRSVSAHLVLAAVSAILLALAFPRPGWGLLAHVALVPLVLLALRSASAKRLVWTTFLVGFAWWLLMIRWMIPVTGGGYVALSAFYGLYTPAALLAIRGLDRHCPLGRWLPGGQMPMVLVVPMVWVSVEFIRGHFPAGGFNWFALGHSQAPHQPSGLPPLSIQIADLFGEYAVSFLVGMTNGLIVDLLSRRIPSRTVRFAAGLWVAALGFTLAYGYFRLMQSEGPSPLLRVAVIQTNVPQDNKNNPTAESEARYWREMIDLTTRAHDSARDKHRPHLYVWPETMVPAPLNEESIAILEAVGVPEAQAHQEIGKLARQLGAHLIVGAEADEQWRPVNVKGQTYHRPARRYNSAYLYRPDGAQEPVRYDKIFRVPFGEYVPWVEHWPWLKERFIHALTPHNYDYTLTPGQSYSLFDLRVDRSLTVSVGTPICFEDTIPRATRRMMYDAQGRKRGQLLVNLTNDGWFAASSQPLQQLQIATLRCVETRVPMARSVNTGVSGFIDSNGRIGPQVSVGGKRQNVPGFAIHEMPADHRSTLFGRIGEAPAWAMLILTGLLLLSCFAPGRHASR